MFERPVKTTELETSLHSILIASGLAVNVCIWNLDSCWEALFSANELVFSLAAMLMSVLARSTYQIGSVKCSRYWEIAFF